MDLLKKTNGRITWGEIASQMRDIVDKCTIRTHVQSLDGFRVRKNRILPYLDQSAKDRRVVWAQTFWMFWKCISALDPEKYVVVLCHMDEKWFYAIRTRSNQKVVTSEGVLPCDFHAQHKSHIGKEMYVAMTGYQLNGNDITKGGKAFLISLVRVGRRVKVTKDLYKRVYKDDGTYH